MRGTSGADFIASYAERRAWTLSDANINTQMRVYLAEDDILHVILPLGAFAGAEYYHVDLVPDFSAPSCAEKEASDRFVHAALGTDGTLNVSFEQTADSAWYAENFRFDYETVYPVAGLYSDYTDVFIGSVGQGYFPYVFLLTSEGAVEYVNLLEGLTAGFLCCGGPLGGVGDIAAFESGEVEEDYGTYQTVFAVDKNGEEINRNRLIALISAVLLSERAGTIVTDSVTSDGLAAFIAARGGKHCRFKRGYKNVINEAIRLNEAGEYAPLAIETSGHAALKENYFLDDGAYLVTRLLIALAKAAKSGGEITDIIKDLPMPKEAAELRPTFARGSDFAALGKGVLADLEKFVSGLSYAAPAPDNREGVRVNFDKEHGDGWALVRMSLHEPILPVNIESETEGGVKKIAAQLYKFLQAYPFLELSAFDALLS